MGKSKIKFNLYLMLIWTSALLSGCADLPSCGWVEPIYIKKEDMVCLAKPTKQQIVTHNESWQKQSK